MQMSPSANMIESTSLRYFLMFIDILCGGVSVEKGGDPLEFGKHRIHLIGVYIIGQPCDAVACDVLAKLIDESLCPLAVAQILVCFGVAVDHLIVADPESDVPCCVVCPTVHAVSCVVFSCIVVGRGTLPRRAVPAPALSHC